MSTGPRQVIFRGGGRRATSFPRVRIPQPIHAADPRRRGVVAHFPADSGVMLWCHTFGAPAGRGMATLPGSRTSCLPIRVAGRGLGVLMIGFDPPRDLTRDEQDLLTSATQQAAARLAMLR